MCRNALKHDSRSSLRVDQYSQAKHAAAPSSPRWNQPPSSKRLPASNRQPSDSSCKVRMMVRSASPNRIAVDFTPIFRSSSRSTMA
ncbi:hypothetical protein D3C71_2031530 [compost metagenome]